MARQKVRNFRVVEGMKPKQAEGKIYFGGIKPDEQSRVARALRK